MKRTKNISIVALVMAGAAMLPNPIQAGEVANNAQQKCLELTRIAADSMHLTPADEKWCLTFGQAAEMKNAGKPPDTSSRPAKISHAELAALIARFISQNPKYANEPLAAKTMYAISALVSGEMR